MLKIAGGHVVDPKSGMDERADIWIHDGKIVTIVKAGEQPDIRRIYEMAGIWKEETEESGQEAYQIIDAAGLVVAPGLVDVHVHFRDPGLTYKEDIHTGAAAAAKGGFTTVVCMANTKPAVDHVETLSYVLEEGRKTGIHVLSAAAVTLGLQGSELTDMEALKAAGAAGFTDDGIPILDEKLLVKAMEEAKRLRMPLSFHEEDPAFITNNGINRGAVSEKLGIGGSPALAEDAIVARDCMIALHTGARVNIQHISSRNSVRAVKLAKELGADVWAEVTPHHFSLTENAVLEFGTLAKMNPPLRTEKDREALIRGLQDGTIDMIATDHAPHSWEEKEKALTEAPSGIIGLETALALGITNLVRPGHLTISALMEKMSLNPARLYYLDKGWIGEGAAADLVLFNPDEAWTVGGFASKSSNSPFTGQMLYGKVKYTICDGKIVNKDAN